VGTAAATGDADGDAGGDELRTARVVLRVRPRLPIATAIECEYVCSADDGRVLSGKGCVAPPCLRRDSSDPHPRRDSPGPHPRRDSPGPHPRRDSPGPHPRRD
jgi:hypothetical protein